MKKIFSIFALGLAALTFASCAGEEDDLFSQSAAERLNAASDLYSSRLTASPNGWAMQLYPTTQNESPYGNGYLVLLRFHTNHQVDVAMNNLLTYNAYQSATSMWEVITDDGPVLSFDTYNDVMHKFSDPEDVPQTGTADDANDETGTGIGGDFEFIIVDAPEDASYMMLKGKKRGTYNLLTPMEEGVDFQDYINDVQAFQNRMFPSGSPASDYIHYGDSVCYMVDAGTGLPNIYPLDGDPIIDETFNPFIITKRGTEYYLRFRDAKTIGGVQVQDYHYDTTADRFIATENENCYIVGSDPLQFFVSNIESASNVWTFNASNDASEAYTNAFNTINDQFRQINNRYRLSSLQIRMNNGQLQLHVPYANNGRTAVDYNLTMTSSDSGVTFAYTGPANQAASNILSRISGIQTFLDLLTSGQTTVSAGSTCFDLSTIKLTTGTDYFVISL